MPISKSTFIHQTKSKIPHSKFKHFDSDIQFNHPHSYHPTKKPDFFEHSAWLSPRGPPQSRPFGHLAHKPIQKRDIHYHRAHTHGVGPVCDNVRCCAVHRRRLLGGEAASLDELWLFVFLPCKACTWTRPTLGVGGSLWRRKEAGRFSISENRFGCVCSDRMGAGCGFLYNAREESRCFARYGKSDGNFGFWNIELKACMRFTDFSLKCDEFMGQWYPDGIGKWGNI